LIANETRGAGNNWTVFATPIDHFGLNGTGALSNVVPITDTNYPPIVSNVILNSTSGDNSSADNLTVFSTTSDLNNHVVNVNYNWRLNGTSITVLNLPMTAPYNNGSKNLTFDFSGNNFDGVLNGAPVWNVSGKYGGSFFFDGVDDYLSVAHDAKQNIRNTLSLEAWINQRGKCSGGCQIMSKQNSTLGSSNERYGLVLRVNDKLTMDMNTGVADSVVIQGGNISAFRNTWVHVVGTYDGATASLYINGVLNASVAKTGNILASDSGSIDIARDPSGDNSLFNGSIDEVRIYNRSLTAAQVAAIYNGSAPRYDRLAADEVSANQNWSVMATPIDSLGLNGTGVLSNNLISTADLIPQISLISPLNATNFSYSNRPLNFSWNATDDINTSLNCFVLINGSSTYKMPREIIAAINRKVNGYNQ